MTRDELIQINLKQLAGWGNSLTDDHATAVMLIGVGHDHNSGKTVLLTLEDMADYDMKVFIEALQQLSKDYQRKRATPPTPRAVERKDFWHGHLKT